MLILCKISCNLKFSHKYLIIQTVSYKRKRNFLCVSCCTGSDQKWLKMKYKNEKSELTLHDYLHLRIWTSLLSMSWLFAQSTRSRSFTESSSLWCGSQKGRTNCCWLWDSRLRAGYISSQVRFTVHFDVFIQVPLPFSIKPRNNSLLWHWAKLSRPSIQDINIARVWVWEFAASNSSRITGGKLEIMIGCNIGDCAEKLTKILTPLIERNVCVPMKSTD